jgi:RNA polymerase sigma-70 factor (ECF subfamily)
MTMSLSRKANPAASAAWDEADFEIAFQQHWERICRTLYRLTGEWDEAQDLALETFVRLYRQPPPNPANPGGWLQRVATHLGLNALRARKRRLRYELEQGTWEWEQSVKDTAEEAEQRIEAQRVRAALAAMPPRAAQLLILRHAGLSYAEIAQALDVSPASVGSLLARAEKAFEEQYPHP